MDNRPGEKLRDRSRDGTRDSEGEREAAIEMNDKRVETESHTRYINRKQVERDRSNIYIHKRQVNKRERRRDVRMDRERGIVFFIFPCFFPAAFVPSPRGLCAEALTPLQLRLMFQEHSAWI